ncbi:MAG: S8 family serine peptidase [Candidatus Daviesbacteria bacterium]|nr:S8 family serine peptidase [Candidatus Daviesbacteria bacterium]
MISKLNTPAAWDITQGDPALVIAIIDSGVDFSHEELAGKGTGVLDDYGHGTKVAGVTAANTNNAVGIAGVCPLCQILSIKVLNSTGFGSDSGVASGIIKASDAGVKVINLSLGSYSLSTAMQSAVDYAWNKGVVIVGAAGNDNSTTKFYPAAFPNVIAVGATTSSDVKSVISNYGDWVDVWAPGQGILSPKMGGSYTLASGTSLAAPHVAGLAGLILSAKSGLTNQQVVDLIISNADDLPGGSKRINAYKALLAATGIVLPPPDTTAPTVSITAPSSGSTVSGPVDINVDATDNVGVTKVDFYVDGVLLGSDISSPYVASWDSISLVNGSSHNISSKAYDLVGNVGTSSTVTVTVNNPVSTLTPTPVPTSTPTPISSDTTPPTVSITNPTNGSILKATSTTYIQASASDNISVSKVEFYVNNSLKCTSAVSPYTCRWKVPGKKNTSYTLSAKAYDTSNNTSSSAISVKAQ